MFEGASDEGFVPFGTQFFRGGGRLDGFNTSFASITPVPVGESYVLKQSTGRDLWVNATAHAASKKSKKRVAVASLDSTPTFGHTVEAPPVSLSAPKDRKGAGKVKTSIDPSELMDWESNTPVHKGSEPHARLTNRIKLQLAGGIHG